MGFIKARTFIKIQKIGFFPLVILSSIFLYNGCSSVEEEMDKNLSGIDSISNVISIDTTDIPYSVTLKRETVFESNENVFINGYIGELAIDDEDHVYITGSKIGSVAIYVFAPDGKFIAKIGRHGRGPGEFESISSLDVFETKLYAFDPRQQKFSVFSLTNFSHLYDEFINKNEVKEEGMFSNLMRAGRLFVTHNENLLIHYQVNLMRDINKYPSIRYYKVTNEGHVIPGKILEVDKYRYFMDEPEPGSDGTLYPFTAPFTRSSLFAISDSGTIYTAWTENFLIKKYNINGAYQAAFYYPIKKSLLSLSGITMNSWKKREVEKNLEHKTWPALNTMEVDDENRLWVSTITESDSTFRWWVLNSNGELLSKFTWAGQRENRNAKYKPLIKIKNGYFYMHEQDDRTGMDRIVKYKIEFTER